VDNETHDRGVKIRMQLDQMVDTLNGMDVGMSLVWLWVWDLIRSKYELYSSDDFGMDFVITDNTTLDVIWNKLWENPPADFTLEYGAEAVDYAIEEWMIEEGFVAALDEDGWLDDEDSDEESDNTTEYGTEETGFKAEPVVNQEEE
jgi:hypothetical protein